jgi:malonate transporter MadL subunit
MIIYGVAVLALCTIIGTAIGELIGRALGIDANVGGVGIAMILLLLVTNFKSQNLRISPESEKGITFWTAMYIPIVIAMAAKQNVAAALSSGWVAILAGFLPVVLGFLLLPVLTKFVARS